MRIAIQDTAARIQQVEIRGAGLVRIDRTQHAQRHMGVAVVQDGAISNLPQSEV